jgi:hypothetical protein
MTQQKKALIVLGVLALVFILFLVSGVVMDRGDRPKPEKAVASDYRYNPWAKRLKKPISMFTPALTTGSLHFRPAFGEPNLFAIDGDEAKAFRTLKLSLESVSGQHAGVLRCDFSYRNDATAIEDLKDQSDTLRAGETSTIAVLKEGGSLSLNPSSGCRVLMHLRGGTTDICERSAGGVLSVNPLFR